MLVMGIAPGASAGALTGILSDEGPGSYPYSSIRGESITIYGQGIYRHMSADVAIQGIAQDWITLCLAVPMLLAALMMISLSSKILFMARAGDNVIPVILIMPAIALVSLTFAVLILRAADETGLPEYRMAATINER
jgi:hypothetical protein